MSDAERARTLLEQGVTLHRAGELWAAVDCYRRAADAEADNPAIFNALGGALANLGETDAAMDAFRKSINLNRDFPDPYLHLGKLYRIAGELSKAEPLLRRAAELDERSYPIWMELGAVYTLANRFRAAAECFQKGLALEPGDAHALHNLGRVAFELGQEKQAIEYYRKALLQAPQLSECHTNLGIALRALGDFDAAQTAFLKALERDPRQAEAINGLVGLLELDGRYDDALARLESSIAVTDDPLLQLAAARIERRLKKTDAALRRVHKLGTRNLRADIGMQREFVLGDLYDDSAQYDEAWAHYCVANQMKNVAFSPSSWARRVDDIIAAFPPRPENDIETAKHISDRPVFIVGMPRSGTSLLEQILASHSKVFGAGELTTLPSLVNDIPRSVNGAPPYPQCMSIMSARRLTRLADAYIHMLASLSSRSLRITDKMWQNFEYLGLIERILPAARVIHCRRDPLDTGLSCFFQNFAGQTGVPFSYDLAHIGVYYRGYERLMNHWKQVCKLPMYELDYETLVSEPVATSKALIEFLDLPWEEGCLDFHNSRRAVNTASVAQVKEPIYTRAVARHTHYEKHLGPLREALSK